MYSNETLSTADEAACPILSYVRIRQLTLSSIVCSSRMSIKTHLRDEWPGPLTASWVIYQIQAAALFAGLRLVVRVEEQADGAVRRLLAHSFVIVPLCLGVVRSTLPQLG